MPQWVTDTIRTLKDRENCDLVLVSPHWGPNMQVTPLPYVQRAARDLRVVGADVIAGHSAHCFQGAWAEGHTLYDMGDFVDVRVSGFCYCDVVLLVKQAYHNALCLLAGLRRGQCRAKRLGPLLPPFHRRRDKNVGGSGWISFQ